MENHMQIDYMQDHEAIPNYQKESSEAIAYKKECFRKLAESLCTNLNVSRHLDIGCGSGYLVLAMRSLGKQSFGAEIGYMYHHGLFPEVKNIYIILISSSLTQSVSNLIWSLPWKY